MVFSTTNVKLSVCVRLEYVFVHIVASIIDFCWKHLDEEKHIGREIFPAQPASQRSDPKTCMASMICSELAADNGHLSW